MCPEGGTGDPSDASAERDSLYPSSRLPPSPSVLAAPPRPPAALLVARHAIYRSTPRVTFPLEMPRVSPAQFGCSSINHLLEDCHQAGRSSLFSLYRTGSFT